MGVILIGLFIFSHAEVWGADWKFLGIVKGKGPKTFDTYYYIEMQSIKKVSSEKVRFWYLIAVKFAEGTAKQRGSVESTIEEAKEQGFKDYMELDCEKKRYRSVKSEVEAREGYVLISPIHWDNIEPDSVYEKMAEVVCRRK